MQASETVHARRRFDSQYHHESVLRRAETHKTFPPNYRHCLMTGLEMCCGALVARLAFVPFSKHLARQPLGRVGVKFESSETSVIFKQLSGRDFKVRESRESEREVLEEKALPHSNIDQIPNIGIR